MGASITCRLLHKLAFVVPGGYSVRPRLHRMRGVTIGTNVWISQYVYIDELHPEAVTLQDNCTIGIRTSLITHLYWGPRRKQDGYKNIIVEKEAYIGPHCLILPGVTIGQGAVIKGGTVVTSSVPAHTFWGPASPGPLARVTVPLIPGTSYENFVRGLKPLKKR